MDKQAEQNQKESSMEPWVRDLLEKLIIVDQKRPEFPFLQGDPPLWVKKVCMDFFTPSFVKTKLNWEMIVTPQVLGEIIGNQSVIWLGVEQILFEIRKKPEKYHQIAEDLKRQTTPEQFNQLNDLWRQLIDQWRPAFRGFLKELAAKLLELEMEQWLAFGEGASQMAKKLPDDPESKDFPRTTTRIYFIMMVCWRAIEKFQTVHEFHEWLRKACGSQIVGDQKRVEKMCQRIGLSFGKPGRPKKRK